MSPSDVGRLFLPQSRIFHDICWVNHSTAILLFARTAHAESEQKALLSSRKRNDRMWERLNARTMKRLRLSGLPVYRSSEKDQRGSTFGERIAGAVDAVFAKGFDKLIIVGNDALDLRSSDISSAIRALDRREAVVGCDRRGGAYLIGLNREQFAAADFAALPWQQSALYVNLRRFLDNNSPHSAVTELRALVDLNCRADLNILRDLLRKDSSLKGLIFGISIVKRTHLPPPAGMEAITTLLNRGPPVGKQAA